jgi:hypothetical protein
MLDAADDPAGEHGRAGGPSLIGDYGFLSDCTSAALVDRDGPVRPTGLVPSSTRRRAGVNASRAGCRPPVPRPRRLSVPVARGTVGDRR